MNEFSQLPLSKGQVTQLALIRSLRRGLNQDSAKKDLLMTKNFFLNSRSTTKILGQNIANSRIF
jgi:hypothetical protein